MADRLGPDNLEDRNSQLLEQLFQMLKAKQISPADYEDMVANIKRTEEPSEELNPLIPIILSRVDMELAYYEELQTETEKLLFILRFIAANLDVLIHGLNWQQNDYWNFDFFLNEKRRKQFPDSWRRNATQFINRLFNFL